VGDKQFLARTAVDGGSTRKEQAVSDRVLHDFTIFKNCTKLFILF